MADDSRPLTLLRAVRDARDLSSSERLVLVMLILRADKKTLKCHPSVATLAADTGLHKDTVRGATKRLKSRGPVRVRVRHSKKKNGAPDAAHYTLIPVGGTRNEGVPETETGDTRNEGQGVPETETGGTRNEGHKLPNELPTGTAHGTALLSPAAADGAEQGDPWGLTPVDDEPKSPYQQIVEHYFAVFERERGKRPAFGKPEGKAVKDLLTKIPDVEEAKRRIDHAFAGFRRDSVTIRIIAGDPDQFAAEPTRRKAHGPVQQNDTAEPEWLQPTGTRT